MYQQLARVFAHYNEWMNDQLFSIAKLLSDDELKAPRGAYFGSIHRSLDHILFGDRVWMNRLARRHYEVSTVDELLFSDFETMCEARKALDSDISNWTTDLTDGQLMEHIHWTSSIDQRSRTEPRWLLMMHMFNHQTHHRGQVTTLLAQCGHPIHLTDLPRPPDAGPLESILAS